VDFTLARALRFKELFPMRCALTVSLVPEARNGPFVFHGDLEVACAHASKLGFHGIEIFPAGGDAIDQRVLRQVLHRNRLELAAVGTGAGWMTRGLSLTSPDPLVRLEARQFIAGIIDFAAPFRAPAIIGSMQGRTENAMEREQALKWLAQALDELGLRAQGHGIPLLVEPLNRYESNLLNTLGQAASMLSTLRTRNVRILADLFHMNIEEASIPEALRTHGDWIGHVHFADSNRLAAGLGHTDFTGITAALRGMGYGQYLSAEVFPRPSSEAAARQTIESFGSLFPAS
jgi:sugar phosphate isomerase/epimerase